MANGFYAGGFAEGMVAADDMASRRKNLGLQERQLKLNEKVANSQIEQNKQELINQAIKNIETFAVGQMKAVQDKAQALADQGDVAGARDFVARAAPVVGAAIDRYGQRLSKYGVTLPSYQAQIASIVVKDPVAIGATEGKAKGAGAVAAAQPVSDMSGVPMADVLAAGAGVETPTMRQGKIDAQVEVHRRNTVIDVANRAPGEVKPLSKADVVGPIYAQIAEKGEESLSPGQRKVIELDQKASILEQLLGRTLGGGPPDDGRGPQVETPGAAPQKKAETKAKGSPALDSVPVVKDDAEYEKLKSGDLYQDPEGHLRRKK